MKTNNITIKDISLNPKYYGYFWLSNAPKGTVLNGDPLPDDFLSENPFVVEAELWDGEKSYSVHQAGNETICKGYEVKEADFTNKDNDEVVYQSKRLKNKEHNLEVKGLRFLECWEPEADEACDGMEALKLKTRVFVGFKDVKQKEEEEKK